MRKIDENIREDHLVFISDDKKKDVLFVEHCNDILQNHYITQGVSIMHDIEYNDGCASQFKCVKAFSSLTWRKTKTTCVFCETSHGKSKSDGLGGVVKSFVSCAVCGERLIICDAKELFEFFEINLTVKDVLDNDKPMLNWHFFYISKEEMESNQAAFPSQSYQ